MMQSGRMFLPPPQLKLPQVGRRQAEMWTALSAHDLSGSVEIFGHSFEYTPQPVPLAKRGRGTAFQLLVNDMPVTLHITADVFATLPAHIQSPELYQMDPEILGLTIEHAASVGLSNLEMAWDIKVEVQSAQTDVTFLTGDALACFAITRDGMAMGLGFLSADPAEDLVNLLVSGTAPLPKRDLRNQQVDAVVLQHLMPMPTPNVAALGPGDVIFPTNSAGEQDPQCYLLIANEHLVRLDETDGGFVLSGPEQNFAELRSRLIQEYNMSSSQHDKSGSIGNPTTVVTIELQRTKMALSDVEALQVGGVFDMDIKNVEAVRICANGDPVADGRLVELDGVIGVQVTRLI